MPQQRPVIAAIPNYNMSDSLRELLPQVLKQGYDAVYVLDDASTDDSVAVASNWGDVRVISGDKNLGPGANRNRLLQLSEQSLGNAILHFIDADVRLVSDHNPATIRRLFENETLGLLGGLIQMPDSKPWMFNFGPRYSFYSQIGGYYQSKINQLAGQDPEAARQQQQKHWRWLKDSPDTFQPPVACEAFWVGEANMMIPFSTFKQMGGFDPKLRYHEIQDLAIKLHRAKYKVRFDPQIAVQHPNIALVDPDRDAQARKAGLHLLLKYGPRLK